MDEGAHIVDDVLGVTGGVLDSVRQTHDGIRVDHVGDPAGPIRAGAARFSENTHHSSGLTARITQQGEGELHLFHPSGADLGSIKGDPVEGDSELFELGGSVTEPLSLQRSAGCVSRREPPQDGPAAAQVIVGERPAGVVGDLKSRQLLAYLEHARLRRSAPGVDRRGGMEWHGKRRSAVPVLRRVTLNERMSEGKIVPVILGGGSGTRLWPISRRHHPKQFHAFLGPETLLQATARRAARLLGTHSPVLVSGEGWETAVDQLDSAGVPPALVVIEPQPRNTAPAVAAAAVALDKDDLLLVLPADHVISGQGAFGEAVEAATRLAEQGLLTTFGVVPTRAETGFGYIERGDPLPGGFAVRRFVEKPEAAAAERFLSTGSYLWNSGMFMFRASAFLSELSMRAPSVLEAARRAVSDATSDGRIMRLGKAFEAAPSISIDHAVMEKTENAAVVPLSAGWNDIGSFQALWEASQRDDAGNTLSGDVIVSEVRGSLVRSEDRLVVVVGLEGVVVIDTPDALLVIARERAQDVKGIVDRLVGEDRPEV